mgnify:CR=1 FL=1
MDTILQYSTEQMLTVVARVLTSQTANIKRKPAIAAGTSRSERMRAHPITWWLKLGAAHENGENLKTCFARLPSTSPPLRPVRSLRSTGESIADPLLGTSSASSRG